MSNDFSNAKPSHVIWFELWLNNSDDRGFYEALLGWSSEPFAEYADSYRVIAGIHPPHTGGALVLPDGDGNVRPGTVIYAEVADLSAAISRAVELGGTIDVPPTLITQDAGAFAIVCDPHGNRIGLWSREFPESSGE